MTEKHKCKQCDRLSHHDHCDCVDPGPKIAELEAQIERMKCCGNCASINSCIRRRECTTGYGFYVDFDIAMLWRVADYWTPAEWVKK